MRIAVALALGLVTTACGQQSKSSTEALQTFDVAEAPAPPSPSAPKGDPAAAQRLKVAVPQMAYVYGYSFRLPAEAVAKVQADHMALCDRLGPARCQVLAMEGEAGGGTVEAATLKLRVSSSIARAFGARLAASVTTAGGRQTSSTITAEDVSKAIVDTEARLRQRTLLVERLTEILRTRKGTVAELVEAERSVAAAQEEIDGAKGWLAELRGRVAMSVVTIRYEAVAAPGASAGGGIADAIAQSWSAFVHGLSALLQIAIFVLPWVLLAGLAVLVARRLGVRNPRRWRSEDPTPPDCAPRPPVL